MMPYILCKLEHRPILVHKICRRIFTRASNSDFCSEHELSPFNNINYFTLCRIEKHNNNIPINIRYNLTCRSRKILEPAQMCDVLKGVVLIACCFILNYVDTSMMYHIVRGQAVIKLYIFYNMLEVRRLFNWTESFRVYIFFFNAS